LVIDDLDRGDRVALDPTGGVRPLAEQPALFAEATRDLLDGGDGVVGEPERIGRQEDHLLSVERHGELVTGETRQLDHVHPPPAEVFAPGSQIDEDVVDRQVDGNALARIAGDLQPTLVDHPRLLQLHSLHSFHRVPDQPSHRPPPPSSGSLDHRSSQPPTVPVWRLDQST
jgi:hypothetical protein